MCFVETAGEMGKSESEIVETLCACSHDIFNAIALLNLGGHEYIEYYIEELTKDVLIDIHTTNRNSCIQI